MAMKIIVEKAKPYGWYAEDEEGDVIAYALTKWGVIQAAKRQLKDVKRLEVEL